MLIFNANSLYKIFVIVLILHWILTFLAFRAYLLEPPPRDYITKRKTQKSSKFKWGKKMVVLILGYALEFTTLIQVYVEFIKKFNMNKHTKIHTWVAEIDFLNTYVTIIQWDRWLNTKMILVVDISDGVEFCIKWSTTLVKWINDVRRRQKFKHFIG